jgi:hypothetical protein
MIHNLQEVIIGLSFIALGIFLIKNSNKKCISGFCKMKDGPNGRVQELDMTAILVGILLNLLGILMILM